MGFRKRQSVTSEPPTIKQLYTRWRCLYPDEFCDAPQPEILNATSIAWRVGGRDGRYYLDADITSNAEIDWFMIDRISGFEREECCGPEDVPEWVLDTLRRMAD